MSKSAMHRDRVAASRDRRTARGRCIDCNSKKGKTLRCLKCATRNAARTKARSLRLIDPFDVKACASCLEVLPSRNHVYCGERCRKTVALWRAMVALRAQLVALGGAA